MANQCLEAVTGELEKAGVRYSVEHGGKHLRVLWGENLEHIHITAATPSDRRAHLNERAQIRRSLTAAGFGDFDDEPADTNLIVLHEGKPAVMSYALARNFSRQHKDVLRAIDNVLSECSAEFNERNFAPIKYVDQKGREHRAFCLTESGFQMIAMGLTGAAAIAWKEKYITAFNVMRAQIERMHPTGDFVRRDEIDAVLELVADIERKQLPAPVHRQAFVPRRTLMRAAQRKQQRRMREPAKDWRIS